ncbi:MAG: hypothetical protein ACR2GF_00525, partial [Acidimicrobiales bacterium]
PAVKLTSPKEISLPLPHEGQLPDHILRRQPPFPCPRWGAEKGADQRRTEPPGRPDAQSPQRASTVSGSARAAPDNRARIAVMT